jgi:hypothetical protein
MENMEGLAAILKEVLTRMEKQGHTDKPEYKELKEQLKKIQGE